MNGSVLTASMRHSFTTTNALIDHIPVRWVEPIESTAPRRLIVFLPSFTGNTEQVAGWLEDLAAEGFVALSLDPWQHGQRGEEKWDVLAKRVFGAFRRHMWPILGQTTLDVLRVLDWAVEELDILPSIHLGGLSMGGDIAVAVAGLDQRIARVVPVVATPDWLRPGMRAFAAPQDLVDQGNADRYAQWFYDHLNPLTHLDRYVKGPPIRFICGKQDNHVPPDGALRFQSALQSRGAPSGQVIVDLIDGFTHADVEHAERWWPLARQALTAKPSV